MRDSACLPRAAALVAALAACVPGAVLADDLTTTWRVGDRVLYSRGCHDAQSVRLALTGSHEQIAEEIPRNRCFVVDSPIVARLVAWVDGPFRCHGGESCSIWEVRDQGWLVRSASSPDGGHLVLPIAPAREFIVLHDGDGTHRALVVSSLDAPPDGVTRSPGAH